MIYCLFQPLYIALTLWQSYIFVHKYSMAFFEWGSLNSDKFSTLIAESENIKADLDKLDLNVAQIYAKKCQKPAADLLALMKVGGWLTAKEALDRGFVNEITDLADEPAPKLTDTPASAMANRCSGRLYVKFNYLLDNFEEAYC